MASPDPIVHPAWLPDAALGPFRTRTVAVLGDGACLDTVRAELAESPSATSTDAQLVIAAANAATDTTTGIADLPTCPVDGHVTIRTDDRVIVLGATDADALRGFYALVRDEATARLTGEPLRNGTRTSVAASPLRMLDHWDNIDVHPWMGQVERGYAGGSIFYDAGRVRADLDRIRSYARLIASGGINAVAINNVNVHAREARLLTDDLHEVVRFAEVFRAYGIRTFLSVSFGSPMMLGGLATNDPQDEAVARWWADATAAVYTAIPDFGGFLVKADSEGQPGPFAYGRTHADGANVIAAALRPHGGTVLWRAFVYDHRQDWRDRTTDRARAAYDHFAPLDGSFDDNVILQVKHGPMDFQVREPLSPVIAAMPHTRVALELQVTQEYTGHQKHICYLAPAWSEYLRFPIDGRRSTAELVAGADGGRPGGIAAVSNVGADLFWTGHPLAQANLYAFTRLTWDPQADPIALLDEWIALTFAAASGAALTRIRDVLHTMMDESWQRYEAYTAPLGVGFMVSAQTHYGPGIDDYEYSKWGTYHFADRDGVGVDRSVATGTGYAGQYPSPWRETYESTDSCPDELLLFFHHVRYDHVLHSGKTVIQHIYDTRHEAVEQLDGVEAAWDSLADLVDGGGAGGDGGGDGGVVSAAYDERMRELLAEQRRSAIEWRDQVRTYFFRKSGIPDAAGHPIH